MRFSGMKALARRTLFRAAQQARWPAVPLPDCEARHLPANLFPALVTLPAASHGTPDTFES